MSHNVLIKDVLWRNDVRIYVTGVVQIEDEEMDRVVGLLDEKRRKKIFEIKSKRERNKCICTGLLLRYAFLQEGYSLDEWRKVLIEYGGYGKPFIRLSNGEIFHYSLSHSGDYIVCATGRGEIGVDIQQIIFEKPFIKIAKRFYSLEEYERVKESEEAVNEFFRIWAAKESYVKYTGRGIGGGISNIIVNDNCDSIYDSVTDDTKKLGRYEDIEGYVMFVCSHDEAFPDDYDIVSDILDV